MEDKLLLFEKEVQSLIEDLNLEVQYVEFEKEGGYNYLRVYIDNATSDVSLDECEQVSRRISELSENVVDGSYMLEVSSPGIERKLKKEKDFIKYINSRVSIKTKSNIEANKSFEGILLNFEGDNIYLKDDKLGEVIIPLNKVKVAKNIYVFDEEVIENEG